MVKQIKSMVIECICIFYVGEIAKTFWERGVSWAWHVSKSLREGKAALFYSPVDCTDASDMHHSNASLMHR